MELRIRSGDMGLTFTIEIDGWRYRATWYAEGNDVVVRSPYGLKRAPAGHSQPGRVAKTLLW